MKQFLTFVRKEFYHVFRDRKTLLLLFGMPVMQIVLFGFALSNEIKNARVAVYDLANDAASRRIIEKMEGGGKFEMERKVWSREGVEQAFREGRVKMAVVFPAGFDDDLSHLNHAQVQLIADASDPNTANTLVNYASAIIMDYQRERMQAAAIPVPVSTEVRMIYNPELKSVTNFVPGVMALILLLICVLMTSVSIVKEKELGTMEVLLVSPFHPLLVIISKAVPYFFLSLINLTVILILSVTLMGMPIAGSLWLLYGVSSIFIMAALSLGLFISNVTHSQEAAMLISLLGMLIPTLLFTGFMFPIENMPLPLQVISNIVISKWYYIIVKSIMIKGLGLAAVWKETLILVFITVLLLTMSARTFKNRLA